MTPVIHPLNQIVHYVAFQVVDMDSSEHDETLQSLYKQKLEAPSILFSPLLCNIMLRSESSVEGNVSSSHREPNIANVLWNHSRRNGIAE
ncbi:hypothetical protein GIB67_011877 [Kingdonia uniflora]|uniref:Uncharacterized protein n=1 Tax=Kingdonia uniflora TaxID=39325 RepID=A0A7J7KVS2_9MAGN|nr:hypothetical protein GIB67_011877 [Kingdonia uniflora]